jgi:hypothetical protein
MQWTRWSAAAIAVLLGGWMLFDGLRALVIGDYVTPRSGEHAGQLGPWASLVRAVGLNPRSTGFKVVFVVLGVWWLAAGVTHAIRPRLGARPLAGAAVVSLWYLPFGTVLGLAELAILWRYQALSGREEAPQERSP